MEIISPSKIPLCFCSVFSCHSGGTATYFILKNTFTLKDTLYLTSPGCQSLIFTLAELDAHFCIGTICVHLFVLKAHLTCSLCPLSLRLPAWSHGAPVRELQVLEGFGRDEV